MDLLEMYLKSNGGGYVHWSSLHQYHSEYINFVFDAEKRVIENAEQFIKGLNAELELKIANDQELQKSLLTTKRNIISINIMNTTILGQSMH